MTFDKKEKKALFEKKREGFLKEKKDVVPVATNNESFGEEVAAEVIGMGDEFVRVRMPRNKEVLGILESRLGGSRCRIKCLDAKTRICRIPGRLKRKLWVREGDVVLVEPWEFEGDEKGDIIHKYYPNQVTVLKKKGLLKNIEQMNEF